MVALIGYIIIAQLLAKDIKRRPIYGMAKNLGFEDEEEKRRKRAEEIGKVERLYPEEVLGVPLSLIKQAFSLKPATFQRRDFNFPILIW